MSLANKVLKIYNKIPLGILNCAAPFYHMLPMKLRYGKTFCDTYDYLMNFDHKDESACRKVEAENFTALVKSAYENVPYYRRSFQENNIDLDSFKGIEEISHLPFLTKQSIQDNSDDMIREGQNKSKLLYVTTSGSTGQPLVFYQSPGITMKEWAYTNYLWSRVGYRPNSSRLVLRGKVFRNQRNKGADWQWDAFKRELSCNIFNMTRENLELYCRKIEKYRPEYIHGYMSAITVLCKYIEKRGLKHNFKGILATSETVIQEQREYVESILHTRVFSFYGHSERLVIAAECEYSTEYHVEPCYGVAEIVDKDGNIITEPGIEGELVATGFLNFDMPLIRYKTGDIAEWSDDSIECACGRKHKRIKRVAGRWNQDVLVNKGNAIVSLTAINMHSDVFKNILKYQFFQEEVGKVKLKIVVADGFTQNNKTEIKRQIYEKLGESVDFVVEEVQDIPVNTNGKYKIVDQKLDLSRFQ